MNEDPEEYENILAYTAEVTSSYCIYDDLGPYDPDGADPAGEAAANHDIVETSALCYRVRDNGGLTPTCAIDSTSPALGFGSNAGLSTDQRGVQRGLATVERAATYDMGAYQWIGPTYANNDTGNDANSGLSGAPKKHVYAAANLAGPGSTANVAAGTYLGEYHWDVSRLEYCNIDITKPLTLTGAGAASTVIDDSAAHAGDDDTIIDAYPYYYSYDEDEDIYGPFTISGFTLQNAQGVACDGGGLYVDSEGVTTIRDCALVNNHAEYDDDYDSGGYGGGVYFEGYGEVALIGCNITNNFSSYDGGGIYVEDSEITISGCEINGNTTSDEDEYYSNGGGIYSDGCYIFSLTDSTVNGNSSTYYSDWDEGGNGGGIYVYDADNATISGCEINENTAGYVGGGIYFDDCDIFSLTDSNVNGNSSSDDGGGISGDEISGDEYGDYTLISRCTFDSNTAEGSGGGIYLYDIDDTEYPVTIEACTLSNNKASGDGGGMYNCPDSAVDLTNCTIYGNSLTGSGGSGGGVHNAGHAELLNCTVASNDAGASGTGGGYYEQGTITGVFENTILANNTANILPNDIAGTGTVTSNGHNICKTNALSYFTNPTDKNSTDPGLVALADNGGPTFTCAIGATSPAYDGTAETTSWFDQRGVARPKNTYWDVGAYEYDGAAPSGPTVTSITPNSGANTGSVNITNLAGTNFVDGATVKLTMTDQADISGSSVAFVSSSKLTCTFNLTGAATGAWNVVVTNPDTLYGTLIDGFTVTAPGPTPTAPTITSVSPNSGMWGETLAITITGTNFTGATSVSFGPGVTVTFTVVSPTQINATITIAMGADTGARNVTVTTPQGSATRSFTVNANPSLLTGTQSHGGGGSGGSGGGSGPGNQGMTPVSMPNIVVQSATVSATKVAPGETVTITANLANKGTVNATSAVKVYINGQEEAVQGVTVNSGSNRPVSFTLSRNEPGTYTVYVGGTQAGSFTVEQAVDPNMILLVSTTLFLAGLVLGAIYIRRRQNYY